MADVVPWLGPAASVITAVGALPLAGLAQNRGESRVRASIANNIKTIKELDGLNVGNNITLKKKLEQCLDDDFSALAQIVQARNEQKERNVPSLTVGIVFSAALTVPLWLMWRPQAWWTWLIFVILAVAAALMLVGGLLAWRKPPSPKNT